MAGIEPLKKSIRIWWIQDGYRERETLNLEPTAPNLAHAERLAQLIDLELASGTFDRMRLFPHSNKVAQNLFGYYIDLWLARNKTNVAPSSWRSYCCHLENHIRPYWGHRRPEDISGDEIDRWINNVLMPKLSNKTIREVLTRWRKVWQLWARRHPQANDPSAGIVLRLPDPDEIEPFTRAEIDQILAHPCDPDLQHLWTCMLWSGLSIHEIIPLALEDLDLDNGVVYVNRSYVRGHYRVTKTRRRKRCVHLLAITQAALQKQVELVKDRPLQTIEILNRDNRTYKKEKLHWLWYCKGTRTHYNYDQIKNRWRAHLVACGVKYRGANNGRHTYASQLLTSGAVPIEWLANQMGHCSTQMIHQHYGRLINTDAPDHVSKLNEQLKLG